MENLIPNPVVIVFVCSVVIMIAFMISMARTAKLGLIHWCYFIMSGLQIIWMVALILLRYTPPDQDTSLFVLDSIIYLGVAYIPVMSLYIALSFSYKWKKLPWWAALLLVFPTVTNLLVWTNPYHHLVYKVFSVDASVVQMGPWIYISGAYSYLCMTAAIVVVVVYAIRSESRLAVRQTSMFILGGIFPMVTSIVSTFQLVPTTIYATPLSTIATIVFHGIAIYSLHLLDIRPIATRQVLDWVSDGYLILSDTNVVVSYNLRFRSLFGKRFGITENRSLRAGMGDGDPESRSGISNLLSALGSCRQTLSHVSYEQSLLIYEKTGRKKLYFMVDVAPLLVESELSGFVVSFKDVTQLKESMQRLQDTSARMMEQERLAFLGQMVGGLAHNLKTPIMSISGAMTAMETLFNECGDSIGDPEVTPEDWDEILGELRDWSGKVRESCAYMSDIITAVKGQATNATTSEEGEFTVDELLKRAQLLMRHELQAAGCQLVLETNVWQEIVLRGGINNLIQVLDNLLSNAIYAQKQKGGGAVVLGVSVENGDLRICVKDTGPGIPERVRGRLFREMITSKGAAGTGLGLYISNAVVRGKFGGEMWFEDNPGGGSVFGITIPGENFTVRDKTERRETVQ